MLSASSEPRDWRDTQAQRRRRLAALQNEERLLVRLLQTCRSEIVSAEQELLVDPEIGGEGGGA